MDQRHPGQEQIQDGIEARVQAIGRGLLADALAAQPSVVSPEWWGQQASEWVTADDDLNLPENEKALLDQGGGRVLLFQLIGPMIFGLAKTISR